MSTQATSTQVLSGAFKHGAGRIILLALGGTVVAAALVTAVAVRQSPGSDASPAATGAALLESDQAQHGALIEGTLAQVPEGSAFAAVQTSALSEAGPRTTYLVASQEQADAVALGINEANLIRVTTGLTPMPDTVLVVGSDAEAEAARAAIADGNRILVGLGEPEELVVDLRTK